MLLVFGGSTVAFFLRPVLSAGDFPAILHRMFAMLPLGLLFGGAACVGLLCLLSHSSSISRETYERVHIGSVARITYLPRDPEISRMAQSSAREDAEGKLGVAKWMFGVACTFLSCLALSASC